MKLKKTEIYKTNKNFHKNVLLINKKIQKIFFLIKNFNKNIFILKNLYFNIKIFVLKNL